MAKIIGSQKFKAKKDGKEYVRVYFTWVEDAIHGEGCDSTICNTEYFDKLSDNLDFIRVGYDREKKTRFLYVSR